MTGSANRSQGQCADDSASVQRQRRRRRRRRMTAVASGGRTVEVHIFDFDREIYGKRVIAYCIERLREEVKFPSAEDLIEQLQDDRRRASEILRENGETA